MTTKFSDDYPAATKMVCEHCKRMLDMGVDVLSVNEGVMGPRGIVPMNKEKFFCSDQCLSNYHDHANGDLHTMPSRIPKIKRQQRIYSHINYSTGCY